MNKRSNTKILVAFIGYFLVYTIYANALIFDDYTSYPNDRVSVSTSINYAPNPFELKDAQLSLSSSSSGSEISPYTNDLATILNGFNERINGLIFNACQSIGLPESSDSELSAVDFIYDFQLFTELIKKATSPSQRYIQMNESVIDAVKIPKAILSVVDTEVNSLQSVREELASLIDSVEQSGESTYSNNRMAELENEIDMLEMVTLNNIDWIDDLIQAAMGKVESVQNETVDSDEELAVFISLLELEIRLQEEFNNELVILNETCREKLETINQSIQERITVEGVTPEDSVETKVEFDIVQQADGQIKPVLAYKIGHTQVLDGKEVFVTDSIYYLAKDEAAYSVFVHHSKYFGNVELQHYPGNLRVHGTINYSFDISSEYVEDTTGNLYPIWHIQPYGLIKNEDGTTTRLKADIRSCGAVIQKEGSTYTIKIPRLSIDYKSTTPEDASNFNNRYFVKAGYGTEITIKNLALNSNILLGDKLVFDVAVRVFYPGSNGTEYSSWQEVSRVQVDK